VVGGAGYIGSHAARALREAGYEVVIYDNLSTGFRRLAEGFELVEGDIADEARLRPVLADMDAVMHFAAHAYVGESVENPQKYFRNNVVGGLSLLNCVLEAGIRRFVFSSSCAVYGRSQRQPIPEATAREPLNPYGASKLFFENALEAYGRAYGLRSVSLRYFNAAGADESGEIGEMHHPETHLIPLALAATAANGPELQIHGGDYPTGGGTCIRDYIHVNDLADAHVRALQYLEGDGGRKGDSALELNLGTGWGQSVLEIIEATEIVTGRRVRRKTGPRRPGDAPVLVADPYKAQRVLGWKPKRKLPEIIDYIERLDVDAERFVISNLQFAICNLRIETPSFLNYQLQITNCKFFPYPFPGHLQLFGQHSGFADDTDEIGVGDPARQNVHVDVSSHAGARSFSHIHAEIDAVGPIESAQNHFHPLGENHHLVGGIGGELVQLVDVGVGHDHDMPIRVRICIENDVAMRAAVDDAGLLVAFFRSIAEDAARLLVGASDIGVTPRSPEKIHGGRVAEMRCGLRATGCEPRKPWGQRFAGSSRLEARSSAV